MALSYVKIPSPLVSVIIPTYNRAELLGPTIDSIVGQSFSDFEIILVDDGSTDRTRELFAEGRDHRMRYVLQPNAGEGSATNHGWRLAQGRYAAVVSSDDPVLPGWMETMVAFMEARPSILVGYPDWRVIDAEGRAVETMVTHEYAFADMVAWLLTVPGPGSFIRREALKDFGDLRNPAFRYAPDLDSWLRLALVGDFARVPHELACWRRHPTSITVADRSRARATEMLVLVRSFFARPDIPRDIRRLKRFALSRAYWYAAWAVLETAPLLSDYYLLRSYWISPEDPERLPVPLRRFPRPTASGIRTKLGAKLR
ncbi:glycosyltransferase [Ancylobacter sp. TS-1]|uniref:glycosyltransferase family 2 protein n=1 Tax=Ancylobacter sp. TS-1 TaxID=1850374 RepID=UPI001265B28C|nr:glycosyltransferase [Ancylobacter sp. TS-1]QFR33490.1 glycosyltransferase [Ancylobacter sp. TS-1]